MGAFESGKVCFCLRSSVCLGCFLFDAAAAAAVAGQVAALLTPEDRSNLSSALMILPPTRLSLCISRPP